MGTAGVAGYQRPRRMFRFEPIERCALAVFDNGAGGFPRRWVPRDQAASFKRAVTADNLFVHLVLSGMMIPLMAALWLFRGRLFGTAPVIVAWLACNLVFFPLFLLQQSRMKRGGGLGSFRFALVSFAQLVYGVGIQMYGLAVLYLSFPGYDATMVYFMTVFVIAGFVYHPPWTSGFLFIPSGAAAAFVILRFHPNPQAAIVHVINTAVMLLSAWMFSVIIYRRKAREFMSGRIIEDQNRRLSELAEQDRMTGLLNHEAVLRRLDAEIDRARRIRYPLSIFLFDLDDFKHVNDEYGHLTGDSVLKLLSKELRSAVRGTDVVGRYGGEEFLVVMPATDSGRAALFAERFRAIAAGTDYGEGLLLTVSGGIAEWTGQSASDLVRIADRNLYEAKRTGKNRIVAT